MENRNQEIINRFNESWIIIKNRYVDLVQNYNGFENLKFIIMFIDELNAKNYNNFFRLGMSMHRLIISRSVDNGLRLDQKYIMIETIEANRFEITLKDGVRIYKQFNSEHLNDLRIFKVLKILKDTLID